MLGDNHYIHRLRISCLKQPQFNRHQLLALDHELALSASSADVDHYLAKSSNLLELARASLLDRAANSLSNACFYDDPWTAAAAGIEYLAVLEGETHAELYTHLLAGQRAAVSLRTHSSLVHNSFERLFQCLLNFHTSHQRLDEIQSDIGRNFDQLCNADPQFVECSWISRPRYRLRLPWPEKPLHQWLKPLWATNPTQAEKIADDPAEKIIDARSRWQSRLRSYTGVWPAAKPIEMPPTHSVTDMQTARQQLWPDELMARHWATARDEISSATTNVGLEAISENQHLRFRIEAIWNSLWLSVLLAPLRATATHEWAKDFDSKAALEKATATSYELTGLGPKALLQLPRVQHYLAHNLFPNLCGSLDSLGAAVGEAGFDLLREARIWHSFGASIDFEAAMSEEDPPPQPQPLFYWNKILSQTDLPG